MRVQCPKFGAVAIGRNEGERLRRCLESLREAAAVVYVDSGSTDGSLELAKNMGRLVVALEPNTPFTAARARNMGLRQLRRHMPELAYVQFIDGDCELQPKWPIDALEFLEAHDNVAVVCGRRTERHPDRSVYNWLCDQEWNGPSGEIRACGGDAMMRIAALEEVEGYRDDLIAGEEPELCIRLRAAGWLIWRLPVEMTLHDAAMTRFTQWWRRARRAGYAFGQGAYLHGAAPERHWVWESRRAWLWGLWLPLFCLTLGFAFNPWGWLAWSVYPAQLARQIARTRGPFYDRLTVGLFQLLGRFAEVCGQLQFTRDRLLAHEAQPIEYK